MRKFFHHLVCAVALTSLAAAPLTPVGAAGTLRVGSDVSYAPLEFYAPSTHAVSGFDIDLAQALGQKLGMRVTITNHTFDDLRKAVIKGQFDVAISAISDSRQREAEVDFVDYMLAGSGLLVPIGNPKRIFSLGGLCGIRVAVQQGTSQDIALQAQSKACVALHLGAIKIAEFPTDDQAFAHFESGQSDAQATDYPVVAYLASTSGGKYQTAGRQFDVVPYGIAIAKANPSLRDAIQSALRQIIADGTYETLLKKWHLGQAAMRSAPINAGTLFEK